MFVFLSQIKVLLDGTGTEKILFGSREGLRQILFFILNLLQQNIILLSNESFLWKFTLHKYCHYSNGEIKMTFYANILSMQIVVLKPKELTIIKGSSWQFSTITELEHFSRRRINFS